jgi:hypothetical protein
MKSSDGLIQIENHSRSYEIVLEQSISEFQSYQPDGSIYEMSEIKPCPSLTISNISEISQTILLYHIKPCICGEDGQEFKRAPVMNRNNTPPPPMRRHFRSLEPSESVEIAIRSECDIGYYPYRIYPRYPIFEDVMVLSLMVYEYSEYRFTYKFPDDFGVGISRQKYKFWISFELTCSCEEWGVSQGGICYPVESDMWSSPSSVPEEFIKTWSGALVTKSVELNLKFSGKK